MAQKHIRVTPKELDPAKIPSTLVEGGLLLLDLEASGYVEQVARRLMIHRQGGYAAVDIWLALVLFLCHGGSVGYKRFWNWVAPHVGELASLAGRKSLPSPASLSRGLEAVEAEKIRAVGSWLLTSDPGALELLEHPSTFSYDTIGEPWRFFDLDPTVTTLRHRRLPVDKRYPEAKRRSQNTGVAGHRGRKRGDIQYRRIDLQQAGSGLFVHAHLSTGNGDRLADLTLALGSLVELLARMACPVGRALIRMDGEYGNVPAMTACREAGVPFLTRLNRATLFEHPKVLERLREATWHLVEDSLSGPTRSAAEIGIITLKPGSKTKRPDGTGYEPINIRVVASAFPKRGTAKRGRVLGEMQVEFYAVDLPAEGWPAPEAVTAYYGRTGQENRFAQEDREVGLDRIVSYHLPGQELATMAGLFLMNYRTIRGFKLHPPPSKEPVAVLRRPVLDTRMGTGWPPDPVLTKILNTLDWPALCATRANWSWNGVTATLLCPDGRELVLTTVSSGPPSAEKLDVIFRRPSHGCEECDVREGCLKSDQPGASKHAHFTVPRKEAVVLQRRLSRVRGKTESMAELKIRAIIEDPGLRAASPPLFLPARARQLFRQLFDRAELRIEVDLPPDASLQPVLLAVDAADRQHRRKSWEENNARYRLDERAKLTITIEGGEELMAWMRPGLLQPPMQAAS